MQTAGPISTNGDLPVALLTPPKNIDRVDWVQEFSISNEGPASGWYSVDGGVSWVRLGRGPFSDTISRVVIPTGGVLIKRETGGQDLTGVYARVS